MTTEDRLREISECFNSMNGATLHHDKKQLRFFSTFTHQELHALVFIGGNGPCSMSDIAKHLQLSLSSITGIIDKLIAKKMARRIRSTEDRRIVQVVLTDEATKLYRTAMNGRLDFVRKILNALSSHEQDVLLALFKKVAASLKEKQAEL